MHPVMQAYLDHRPAAEEALRLFRAMCDYQVRRIPGCDTVIRLAWRISLGMTPERAAVREYLYRVNLAIDYGLAVWPHEDRPSCRRGAPWTGSPCLLGL